MKKIEKTKEKKRKTSPAFASRRNISYIFNVRKNRKRNDMTFV